MENKNISVVLPGSKSISNRLLLIKEIAHLNFKIENLSDSDDTSVLQESLLSLQKGNTTIDIGMAGTCMRFLCAYLSTLAGKEFILTGNERMKKRPIKDLVDGLNSMGADISYLEEEGFPPIKITGKKFEVNELSMNSTTSSQFVSAILLIAPGFSNGLKLTLEGETVSKSYILLTLELMKKLGINYKWNGNQIQVMPGLYNFTDSSFYNESDWSGAGYFYSAIALNKKTVVLSGLLNSSIQPDSIVANIYAKLGVKTEFLDKQIKLTGGKKIENKFSYNFINCPDLAQTVAVTCLALGIDADLSGLQTLKIKETNRIEALKIELEKLGANVIAGHDFLKMKAPKEINLTASVTINTYNDHRMAMSFAPLLLIGNNITIENKDVVSKSFPEFWNQFNKLLM